jgi:spore coat protein U-like protein
VKSSRIPLAAALLGASSLALAASPEVASITVNATVPGVCKLTSSTAVTVSITADPSAGGAATGTAPVSFKCTKNHLYTFSITDGVVTASNGTLAGNLSGGGTPATQIPYTASWSQPSGSGAGFSTEVAADVLVTIPEANYLDAPAGSYTAGLTVNINY